MKKLIALLMLVAAASAHADLIFQDNFSYANGSTTNVSGGLWVNHSGTAGTSLVNDGQLEVLASRTEDINRPLGSSIATGSIYYAVTFSITSLPNAGGNYFAHLATSGSSFRERLFVYTNGVASPGNFRLGASGAAGSPSVTWGTDLVLNQSYTAVVGVTLDGTDFHRLWLDPIDISSTSLSWSEEVGTAVNQMAFRQAAGIGSILVDGVAVGTTFDSVVVPEPGTLALLGIGLGALLLRRRRQA